MLFNQTLDKLRTLRLEGMVQALDEQRHQNDIVSLGFEDRLALLVERQWLWKENRGLAIRLKNAQLKINASLEDLDYRSSRGLKRAQIDQLRASQWVKEHRNCLITGPTGSGKLTWPARWAPRLVVKVTARSTSMPPSSSGHWKLPEPTGACCRCSRSWLALR
jgi:DNA replication protein DnaC